MSCVRSPDSRSTTHNACCIRMPWKSLHWFIVPFCCIEYRVGHSAHTITGAQVHCSEIGYRWYAIIEPIKWPTLSLSHTHSHTARSGQIRTLPVRFGVWTPFFPPQTAAIIIISILHSINISTVPANCSIRFFPVRFPFRGVFVGGMGMNAIILTVGIRNFL